MAAADVIGDCLVAVLMTAASARPRFVPDSSLTNIRDDDIDRAVPELSHIGVWQRATGDYQIAALPFQQAVLIINDLADADDLAGHES